MVGESLRVVSAHLGAGASLAALVWGAPVDTTMGFTSLDGLVMVTRCGSLDPGIVSHLIRSEGIGPDEVERALERESGLLGPAGTADLAQVPEAARAGEAVAALAYGVDLHRLRAALAAMVAAMGRLDVLCFTGGAGEGSPVLRADTCRGLGFLGIRPLEDDSGLRSAAAGGHIVSSGAGTIVAVVHTREDLVMVQQATEVLQGPGRRRREP